jgi:hypothetical protein
MDMPGIERMESKTELPAHYPLKPPIRGGMESVNLSTFPLKVQGPMKQDSFRLQTPTTFTSTMDQSTPQNLHPDYDATLKQRNTGFGMAGDRYHNFGDVNGGRYMMPTSQQQQQPQPQYPYQATVPHPPIPFELTVVGGLQRISINLSYFVEGITGVNGDIVTSVVKYLELILNRIFSVFLGRQTSVLEETWKEVNTSLSSSSSRSKENKNKEETASSKVKPWVKQWIFSFVIYILVHKISLQLIHKWKQSGRGMDQLPPLNECFQYVIRFIATGGGRRRTV